ncbi:hypothetical protein FRB96_003813 [Tulasnella sp. 330]|nr:hypothetical protein FRB96_003813 [Tulasnella sp. 330]
MPFWKSKEEEEELAEAHDTVTDPRHKASHLRRVSVSHELIAGAASYEAAKAYEEHQAKNGKPTSHAKAKALMAGFVGAFVDREVETKGHDYIDRKKAKRIAQKRNEKQLKEDYEGEEQDDDDDQNNDDEQNDDEQNDDEDEEEEEEKPKHKSHHKKQNDDDD